MEDGRPIGYFISIVFLILGGAYFAGTEIALASVNRIRMMSYADNGNRRASRVLYILDHFDKALTTLLIGNNIMHIGCASIATLMATKLWGLKAVPVTTVVTTVVVFLVSEMIPKRFAKACNERFALAVSGSLIALMKIFTPVSFVFSKLSAWVSKPFKKQEEEPTVTEDELYDIIETIAAEGAIDEEKTELVQSALEFSDTFVQDVLTPWEKVVSIPVDASDETILTTIRENAHSRIPVLDKEGHPIGVLLIRKYLKAHMRGETPQISHIMESIHFVDADMPIDDLFPVMSRNKTHLSVVRDAQWKTLGIITMEDILEELVGEIYDEDDAEEANDQGGAA